MVTRRQPRRTRLIAGGFTILLCGLCVESFADPARVSAERSGTEVIVRVEGKIFTKYKFAKSQKYPYFWPIRGPLSGQSVTTESSEPYPHHHSLFFGCDHVNGGNFWQEGNERGQILSKHVDVEDGAGENVVITDRCRWQRPGHPAVFEDRRRFVISAPSEALRFIDVEITLYALVDAHITKTNHALFSARVVEPLSVKGGGTMVNSQGRQEEKATFGRPARWIDMSGRRDTVIEGIAILEHPKNPWFPCKWFTRDYGFMSPTPMYWLGPEGWRLKKDESIRLRYRVVVHGGKIDAAKLDGIWAQWSSQ